MRGNRWRPFDGLIYGKKKKKKKKRTLGIQAVEPVQPRPTLGVRNEPIRYWNSEAFCPSPSFTTPHLPLAIAGSSILILNSGERDPKISPPHADGGPRGPQDFKKLTELGDSGPV